MSQAPIKRVKYFTGQFLEAIEIAPRVGGQVGHAAHVANLALPAGEIGQLPRDCVLR